MHPDQFRRLKELFNEFADLQEGRRRGFLDDVSAADPESGRELRVLLDHDDAQAWIEKLEQRVAALNESERGDAVGATQTVPLPQHSSSLVGEMLDTIKVDKLIGSGGMGDVYRGWDSALQRPVALKMIRREILASDEARGRLAREARLLSQLDHPNICRVYGLLETEHGQCLMIEYLDGVNLREALPQIGDHSRLEIAEAMTAALVAAHDEGIVHRDIKPENFMLLEDGSLKVLDFGVARPEGARSQVSSTSFDRELTVALAPEEASDQEGTLPGRSAPGTVLTRVGSTLGTLSYMSPEQARGEPVTTASDMYSLGLVLQERAGPYVGDTAEQVLRRARRGENPGDLERAARTRGTDPDSPAGRPDSTTRGSRGCAIAGALPRQADPPAPSQTHCRRGACGLGPARRRLLVGCSYSSRSVAHRRTAGPCLALADRQRNWEVRARLGGTRAVGNGLANPRRHRRHRDSFAGDRGSLDGRGTGTR